MEERDVCEYAQESGSLVLSFPSGCMDSEGLALLAFAADECFYSFEPKQGKKLRVFVSGYYEDE